MKNLFCKHLFNISFKGKLIKKCFSRINYSPIVFLLLFISCQKSNFPDKYFAGVVEIRAEKYYPLGMIKIDGTLDTAGYIESPSRALIYHREMDDLESFDLEDTVWFKIKEEKGYQLAYDIKSQSPDSLDLATKHQVYEVVKNLQFNLHNADNHREGPQHTKRHIVSGGPGLAAGFWQLETREVGVGTLDTVHVREGDVPAIWDDPYFFGIICYSICVGSTGLDLYEVTPTHSHTH